MAADSRTYQAACPIEVLADRIQRQLKESYECKKPQDQTILEGKGSLCRIDTYQIWSSRGFITVILCFFRPDLSGEDITVKVTPIVPTLTDSTAKSREIQEVIQEVILANGGALTAPADTL